MRGGVAAVVVADQTQVAAKAIIRERKGMPLASRRRRGGLAQQAMRMGEAVVAFA
jgi:hypothetical protein